MSMLRWDPTEDLVSLRDAMNRLMEESFVPAWNRRAQGTERGLRLPLDAYVTQDEIVITASVPGLNAEDVEITLEGDTLTIRGELKAPIDNVDYVMQERPYGVFSRSLVLNIPVDVDKADASFENGVLTLKLPKAQEVRPRTIKVQSQGKNI